MTQLFPSGGFEDLHDYGHRHERWLFFARALALGFCPRFGALV
jgi:hypothetical protein